MFQGRAGDKIAIILTDGKSNDPEETWKEAARAKKAGIHIIAIGVGAGAKKEELEDIASSAADVYQVTSFDMLQSLQPTLIRVMCNGEFCN